MKKTQKKTSCISARSLLNKETAGEIVSQDSDTEQAYLAFICKRLKLNFRKLSVEERKWLKKIAEKSDLLKNPKPQRGRR